MIGKASFSTGASAATSAGVSPCSSSVNSGGSSSGSEAHVRVPGKSAAGSRSGNANSGACAAANDVIVLTIIRSGLWVASGSEDVLKVEVDLFAKVADVKARIAELYEIPEEQQRLQRTEDPRDPCLQDAASIGPMSLKPLYLLPALAAVAPSEPDLDDIHLEMQDDASSDEEQERAAVLESLESVAYRVQVLLDGALGPRKGSSSSLYLTLAALALAGDVQALAEVDMLGVAGSRPLFLVFNGQALPPTIPLHIAGVRDGDTLVLAAGGNPVFGEEDEDSDADSLDDAMLEWAGRRGRRK